MGRRVPLGQRPARSPCRALSRTGQGAGEGGHKPLKGPCAGEGAHDQEGGAPGVWTAPSTLDGRRGEGATLLCKLSHRNPLGIF